MQTGLPFVSIIVPAYNASDTIAACVRSLSNQRYPSDDYEIIVVDNNSRDDTDKIAAECGAIVVYERTIQAAGAARNKGIAAAKGQIIAFTDSDCIADEDWLLHLISAFDHPEVGGASGIILAQPQESLVERFFVLAKPYERSATTDLRIALTGNVAFRADALRELTFFDEYLPTAEDVDLGYRMQLVGGYRLVDIPEAIVYHKFRSTVGGLYQQYNRYGYSEILLTTLYKDRWIHGFRKNDQLCAIAKQPVALLIYLLAFSKRTLLRLFGKCDAEEWARPALLTVAEIGNIFGKLTALRDTRWFKTNPFPSRPEIVR